MRFDALPYRNLAWYRRYYLLTAAAVIIAVGVITGSLVVGDSVRTTLVRRVAERLGDTETVVFSRGSYMDEGLAAEISSRGVLLVEGFVSNAGKLVPVTVWGVDGSRTERGTARVNPSLAAELGGGAEYIALRLPSGGLVPSGSLLVSKNYTTSMRLAFGGVCEADEGGNINLRNEQTRPLNIFVERAELAEAMGVAGKINLILSPKRITAEKFAQVWTPASSGFSVRRAEGFGELTSDRVFIQGDVARSVSRNSASPNRLFSYLVNSISAGGAIPYSFATAMDSYGGVRLAADEAIVSDYTARRLGIEVGDEVSMEWFTSGDLKTLSTDSVTLRVGRIVPIEELVAGGLSADFPGLSDVERCTDWDSDLPIDMNLIADEDERYWELWRDTPKIIVPYAAVADSWGNEYGTATAIRTADPDLSRLTPVMTGIEVVHPRETGMAAARGGVDFSSLFLALGCFIVASAMLLMTIPLGGMLRERGREYATMAALGFTRKRIVRMAVREAAPLVSLAALVGTLAGILYTGVVMWLLGSVWRGATHTEGFSPYPGLPSLAVGFAAGVAISLPVVVGTIRREIKGNDGERGRREFSVRRKTTFAIVATAMVVLSVAASLFVFDSVASFVATGTLFIVAATLWGDALVAAGGGSRNGAFTRAMLPTIALGASRRQAMRSLAALSAGVFIVFSVGLNRKGFADPARIRTGTGGYTLWGESSVPLYHNLSTDEGRRAFSLNELPADTRFLQALRYGADDASCLNLNHVSTPTVLGVDMSALDGSGFKISRGTGGADTFGALASRKGEAYPALVDETVLAWSLGKRLGDTLTYRGGRGERVAIVLAGTLANSLFQGNILIDRALFGEIWPETTGSEVFMAATAPDAAEPTRTLLSQSLAEYGVRVSTAADRLREFNSVTDTYLTIFFTLGCLGLLLGIACFIIAVRQNLASRGEEIRLYRAMGYSRRLVAGMLCRENITVPLYAIATGVVGAVLGAAGGIADTGWTILLSAALVTALFVLCAVWFVRRSSIEEVKRADA